jgi:hypothetical protein
MSMINHSFRYMLGPPPSKSAQVFVFKKTALTTQAHLTIVMRASEKALKLFSRC